MPYARLHVNDNDLIVCSEHGDVAEYVDRSHIVSTLRGYWQCSHPGCIAFRWYDHAPREASA